MYKDNEKSCMYVVLEWAFIAFLAFVVNLFGLFIPKESLHGINVFYAVVFVSVMVLFVYFIARSSFKWGQVKYEGRMVDCADLPRQVFVKHKIIWVKRCEENTMTQIAEIKSCNVENSYVVGNLPIYDLNKKELKPGDSFFRRGNGFEKVYE